MTVNPSEEQLEVIQAIKDGNNVLTDSVAGSGKTTTILFLAKAMPEKKIVVVTYNARLKAETRERVKKNKLQNIDIHSYHSFGLQYYVNPCRNDVQLMNIVRQNMKPNLQLKADILVLDESQDMTKSYYEFLKKVIRDMKNPTLQLFLMGDHMQCIYDFAQVGADSRFLTLAEQIFQSTNPWKRCSLKTSYRITKPMEWFMNDVVLGYPRMKSVKKSSIPVKYLVGDPFHHIPTYIAKEIQMLFSTGLKPSDIFILAPSIRSANQMNPIKKLENMLVGLGIPCFVPLSDEEELRDDIMSGKVVFSSFHQSKGLERKIVFVASFSTSLYYVFKTASQEVCPNIVYVAGTRASDALYLWGEDGKENKPFPFLNHSLMSNGPFFEKIQVSSGKQRLDQQSSPKEYDGLRLKRVTDLTRFLPEESMSQILELCNVVTRRAPTKQITIPSSILTNGTTKENVSDLNGIAIPTMYEQRKTGIISIQNDLETYFIQTLKTGTTLSKEQKEWIACIQTEPRTAADYLKLANIYSSYMSGYIYKISQIQDYSWLEKGQVEELIECLESVIHGSPETMEFEYTLEHPCYEFNNLNVQIAGRADLIDDQTLWEIKCVDTLMPEHIIQLAIYAYLWQTTEYKKQGRRRFCLVNLRTGETQEITGIENLKMVVDICLDNAFRIVKTLSDEDFIESCLRGTAPPTALPVVTYKPHKQTEEACMIFDN